MYASPRGVPAERGQSGPSRFKTPLQRFYATGGGANEHSLSGLKQSSQTQAGIRVANFTAIHGKPASSKRSFGQSKRSHDPGMSGGIASPNVSDANIKHLMTSNTAYQRSKMTGNLNREVANRTVNNFNDRVAFLEQPSGRQ